MSYLTRIPFALFTGLVLLSTGGPSWGKDVQFVARDFSENQSVWQSDNTLLEQPINKDEDLFFVLENPTSAEHTFVMPGVQMVAREHLLSPEQTGDIVEPIRLEYTEPMNVTVKPGESKRVRVHKTGLFSQQSKGIAYRFFCSIHKDLHQAGSLFVM